ncbi:MAG: hypothetical protein RLZZ142_258 [Verrucomicrobiota bacterium]
MPHLGLIVQSAGTGWAPRFGGAGSEEGGADAHEGGAFLDGDFEVVAHAHGKLREREVCLRLDLVAELAELAEEGAGVLGFWRGRGDAHEPVNLETVE